MWFEPQHAGKECDRDCLGPAVAPHRRARLRPLRRVAAAAGDRLLDGVQSIAVDLSAITSADVTGLQVLAGAARHLRRKGGLLIVTGASAQVTSLIKINGMEDLLEVPSSQPLRVVASTADAEREKVPASAS